MSTLHDNRISRFIDAGLYFVTSENMSNGRSTVDIIDSALQGGVKLIQLREKGWSVQELMEKGRLIRKMTAEHDALLIINDRVDVALALNADGVHLGQSDFPIADARRIAPDLIIGSSSHDIPEAITAQAQGASYVNIGPVFPTKTKEWSDAYLGLEGIREISAVLKIPFTVMGGIKSHHISDLRAENARIIALVTAVTAAEDPASAVRELLDLIKS